MNNKTENVIDSFERTQSVCIKNKILWENYKPFANTYLVFDGKIITINEIRAKLQLKSNGASKLKKENRTIATDSCIYIAGRLRSLASATNNLLLMDQVRFAHSDLILLRDNEFKDKCNSILSIATQNKAALADYEITDEVLAQFSDKINAYAEVVTLPIETKKNRKIFNGNIRALVKETSLLLKERLDLDVEYFKKSQPDFYQAYKEARKVIDYGIRHTKKNPLQLSGVVTDFETEQPIAGAMVKIKDTAINTVSDIGGKFVVQLTAAGKYTLEVTYTGYQPYSLEFEIEETESLEIDVELEKEE